jgi:hypothetical protein
MSAGGDEALGFGAERGLGVLERLFRACGIRADRSDHVDVPRAADPGHVRSERLRDLHGERPDAARRAVDQPRSRRISAVADHHGDTERQRLARGSHRTGCRRASHPADRQAHAGGLAVSGNRTASQVRGGTGEGDRNRAGHLHPPDRPIKKALTRPRNTAGNSLSPSTLTPTTTRTCSRFNGSGS